MTSEDKTNENQSNFRIELVARTTEFVSSEPFIVELWLANTAGADANYPMGFEMRNSKTSSAFELTDSDGNVWHSVARELDTPEIKKEYRHSRPIPIPSHGRVLVGGADVSQFQYSPDPFAKPSDQRSRTLGELGNPGPLQLRWYDGEGIIRPPGRTNIVLLSARPPAKPE